MSIDLEIALNVKLLKLLDDQKNHEKDEFDLLEKFLKKSYQREYGNTPEQVLDNQKRDAQVFLHNLSNLKQRIRNVLGEVNSKDAKKFTKDTLIQISKYTTTRTEEIKKIERDLTYLLSVFDEMGFNSSQAYKLFFKNNFLEPCYKLLREITQDLMIIDNALSTLVKEKRGLFEKLSKIFKKNEKQHQMTLEQALKELETF